MNKRRPQIPTDARSSAVRVLVDVLHGQQSLSGVLPRYTQGLPERQQPLLKELCYGVLRWLPLLEHYLSALLRKALRNRDFDVKILLLVGLYQLEYMRIPPHAVVSETVTAAKQLRKVWAAGLVNATLRSAIRNRATRPQVPTNVRLAHPEWLMRELRDAWRNDWQDIARANNERAPMTIRVNAMQNTRADYLAVLRENDIEACATVHARHGIKLDQPMDVESLPGFVEGAVSVQDEASQLAAELLDCRPKHRVLDACAAPGGKSCHLLETTNGGSALVAVDSVANRLARVTDNLRRLSLSAEVVCADVLDLDSWWNAESFDRILLDAPCSATGVIRRHPDIKWLRRAGDLPRLSAVQYHMLDTLWPTLASGGLLLYATCSVLPHENQQPVERFIQAHADAVERVIDAKWGKPTQHGRQILPGSENMDGFFYALIEKR